MEPCFFRFYNGKLLNVGFTTTDYHHSNTELDLMHQKLVYALANKYMNYYDNSSTDEMITFNDNTVAVTVSSVIVNENRVVGLYYLYEPLLKQKIISDNKDL